MTRITPKFWHRLDRRICYTGIATEPAYLAVSIGAKADEWEGFRIRSSVSIKVYAVVNDRDEVIAARTGGPFYRSLDEAKEFFDAIAAA